MPSDMRGSVSHEYESSSVFLCSVKAFVACSFYCLCCNCLCNRDVYKRQLIDQIYVQERNDNTDEQCAEAKAAWDALTDAQKELVEGENADPDYFGRDTGDASKDDPLNADEIGENELLVVSFGTSFNDSRAEDKMCIRDRIPLKESSIPIAFSGKTPTASQAFK